MTCTITAIALEWEIAVHAQRSIAHRTFHDIAPTHRCEPLTFNPHFGISKQCPWDDGSKSIARHLHKSSNIDACLLSAGPRWILPPMDLAVYEKRFSWAKDSRGHWNTWPRHDLPQPKIPQKWCHNILPQRPQCRLANAYSFMSNQ